MSAPAERAIPGTPLAYMPQLDALRAFAVLAVLIHHFLGKDTLVRSLDVPWGFLRIFPLYYFVVFVLALIDFIPVRELFWWLVTYTVNIEITLVGWFPPTSRTSGASRWRSSFILFGRASCYSRRAGGWCR